MDISGMCPHNDRVFCTVLRLWVCNTCGKRREVRDTILCPVCKKRTTSEKAGPNDRAGISFQCDVCQSWHPSEIAQYRTEIEWVKVVT